MTGELRPITLADIEAQVALHQQAIRDLCESGIRTDEARRMNGYEAKTWLEDRGYTTRAACNLIGQVVNEYQQARKERDDAEGAQSA